MGSKKHNMCKTGKASKDKIDRIEDRSASSSSLHPMFWFCVYFLLPRDFHLLDWLPYPSLQLSSDSRSPVHPEEQTLMKSFCTGLLWDRRASAFLGIAKLFSLYSIFIMEWLPECLRKTRIRKLRSPRVQLPSYLFQYLLLCAHSMRSGVPGSIPLKQ